jgi:hypothetical protein
MLYSLYKKEADFEVKMENRHRTLEAKMKEEYRAFDIKMESQLRKFSPLYRMWFIWKEIKNRKG